ncbi:MAG TPA: PLP-dependent aminotransferase family protein [Thermoanaerobaculaceae bacterium]|nr:PLP-dependent aminotransferase family protein [Thermoanaerobaculaceae bacterium]
MAVQFAKRMESLKASEIREILKVTQRPEVISFAGGLPAPECFPVDEMREVAARVLSERGRVALQYSTTEGDPALRRAIAERMRDRLAADVPPEEVLITSGSQQGLDLTGKVFLDEGDAVLCESPTYLGAINALQVYRPRFVEVPTDDDGMLPEELDKRLAAEPRAKLAYVIPDFQNPTGRTWSLARRHAFMEIVSRRKLPVVEDNPYGELRFEGTPLPALKAIDPDGLVVFLGTFSKIFCPGLRIGWLAARRRLLEKYVVVKQGADLHTSTLAQMQIAAYVEAYDLDDNVARIREVYRRRRDAMIRAIEAEFPPGVRFTRPHGGLFLWVELPASLNAREVLARCVAENVAFVPGGSFFPNGGHENTFRLNFSNMPEPRIAEGIARLGRVLRELVGRVEPSGVREAGVAAAG